ncbi:bifunctional (p)ppGpp synthetase/guanosine-3',5'-bis(diphosphate) 3'-pyrophosphohydrolase [Thiomonas sp.]|uniref:RelA/SpoT family protein n=1 Tax=Thiomonas sp. TaxID=2047785 RepID=UPI0026110D63|nr:bifunctional (p)ppGpp synthetase/guanosine-3',5'-bis(diphosphate) 3'-pyrophosphohydrolase [Thiomonas sp.]
MTPARFESAHTARLQDSQPERVAQARAYALALIDTVVLETGEPALEHADGVRAILADIGADDDAQAAAYLNLAVPHLAHPHDQLRKHFGEPLAALAVQTRKLVEVSRMARGGPDEAELRRRHIELVRRLLLGFSRDLRVALLRLASRLQSLRFFTRSKSDAPAAFLAESMEVYAPLANRLGIWQIKWELEDLAFRLMQPAVYKDIARQLDERRVEREQGIQAAIAQLHDALRQQHIAAQVVGRPKHIYSIWRKMQGKQLRFDQVMDLRALRIIVADVNACYAALSVVHSMWTALPEEFDDYIARPKPNGYQSLHTVVRTGSGQIFEIQIRTEAMHAYAEHGSAAHWAYKEAGVKGYQGQVQADDYQTRIALARQLLALQQELARGPLPASSSGADAAAEADVEDRIFVLTPQARIVELVKGATPVDFAYALHTDLGHRCRGARVDGALVPLTTPLRSGQTVEIVAAKEGGPSRDWLNPELGYLRSPRARAKVRAWFNQIVQQDTIAKGRAQVERLLQREGKTSVNLQTLAEGLGFGTADELFERVGKEEFSLRQIETFLRAQTSPPAAQEETVTLPGNAAPPKAGGQQVLVVGVGSLLTQLASCCKPAPPDVIGGFVTREKGVSVHRINCPNFRNIARQHPERVIAVTWSQGSEGEALYPVDIEVSASDRQGLLRDISEVLTKERINVIAVNTRSIADRAQMRFTVQLSHSGKLRRALGLIAEVPGVMKAWRR